MKTQLQTRAWKRPAFVVHAALTVAGANAHVGWGREAAVKSSSAAPALVRPPYITSNPFAQRTLPQVIRTDGVSCAPRMYCTPQRRLAVSFDRPDHLETLRSEHHDRLLG